MQQAVLFPQLVQSEYLAGHQLGSATWSNATLTTLSTDEIIAELGWGREAVRQITGVSPILVRPFSGDVDDRVRAIVKAMNMTLVVPTAQTMISEDGAVFAGTDSQSVVTTFDQLLDDAVGKASGITLWT